jgi:heptosyltransferase-1
MKVLLIKTSSFGDIIHTLPAVADLLQRIPDVELSWMVEESFEQIPLLNPRLEKVIPVAIRRWRQSWLSALPEIHFFFHQIRETKYDVVIDAQGLIKSALLSKMAKGHVHGLDAQSSREPSSRIFYDQTHFVEKEQHAVKRVRELFSKVFEYELNGLPLDYGIDVTESLSSGTGLSALDIPEPHIFFLHGTTWASKHWPESRWRALALLCQEKGYGIRISYGNEEEKLRAERIVNDIDRAKVLAPSSISELVSEMRSCSGVVSVDTGLGHLATALNIPLVGIYGATDPNLTGFHGERSNIIVSNRLPCIPCLRKECGLENRQVEEGRINIYPPCYETTTADRVYNTLHTLMLKNSSSDKD